MNIVRQTAMFCVGRAVLFGCLGIGCVMLSFAFDSILFFRSGAILCLTMSVILVWFAETAHKRLPKKTETWILLSEEDRPYNDHATRAFKNTLKEVYGFFAYYSVVAGVIFLTISLGLDFAGVEFGLGKNSDHPSSLVPFTAGEP